MDGNIIRIEYPNIIVGLDLSTQNTGVTVLKQNGTIYIYNIKVTPKIIKQYQLTNIFKKSKYIVIQLSEILREEINIDFVIEDTFCNSRNMKTSKTLIQLGAIVRHEILNAEYFNAFGFFDVEPTKLKKYMTNKGNAKKEEMIEAVKNLYPELKDTIDDNTADSTALCLYFKNLMLGD